MSPLPLPALLDRILRTVRRRYRLASLVQTASPSDAASPAADIATTIEAARAALAAGDPVAPALRRGFIDALARMIREAIDPRSGDPAFQAAVLRHDAPGVREYASLTAHAEQDRRTLRSAVNALAHPAKRERLAHAWQRDALAELHAAAFAGSWGAFRDALQRLRTRSEMAADAAFARDLDKLQDSAALERLLRIDALALDPQVREYRALIAHHGPESGSTLAVAQGATSHRRGAAVEASAAQALGALAQRLDADDAQRTYRVVTSMRVPSSIPGRHDRAKTEWDAVLLDRARDEAPDAAWHVRFLVEAKASADAATTDLPRLLRGLNLLAQADRATLYSFETREGAVRVHGASLAALTTDEAALQREVIYCCDTGAEVTPRMLSAASRMQLLSAQASLDYASALARGADVDAHALGVIWDALVTMPQWRAVLHQYATLRQVRELMVRVDDLLTAIDEAAGQDRARSG
ncbi:hypothetical protein DM39_6930 [Burkholderia cenocepacia]|uniref:3-deoxy-D-arabino-heptulosonate 7-phosphate synthase n=1 Tax=Burkholderia cenocepacia TaxID=95486 RepID=A0AAN0RN71_9BURK|nr:hypothetical protein DM39_6930 [Burkholderia cenocepacia]